MQGRPLSWISKARHTPCNFCWPDDRRLWRRRRRLLNDPHTPWRRLLNDRTHYATAVGCTHDGRQLQLKQIANRVSCTGRLMQQMSLTRTHHATIVGPIRFSNRSNNCRVCKINGRQLSLVRTHHATIVFSSSLHPTEDKNRMVCAGLNNIGYLPQPIILPENTTVVELLSNV